MRRLIFAGVMGMAVVSGAAAQKVSPADRMAAVVEANSLDARALKPWDLRFSFQTFDEDGKPAAQGTLEEWWAAPDRYRIEIAEGAKKTVLLDDGGKFLHSDGAFVPTEVQLLADEFVHPVETMTPPMPDVVPEVRAQSFGTLKTECILLTHPAKAVAAMETPLGLFPTYCVQDNNAIRINWLSFSTAVAVNQVGEFQGHVVPTKLTLSEGKKTLGEAHVEKLATVDAAAIDFTHDGLLEGRVWDARVSSAVMAGLVVKKVQPVYPAEARVGHVQGSVVMMALIGTDGHIRQLHVVQSPNPLLSIAAMAAAQQWEYKPYVLNGTPTSVQTVIVMNFALN